MRIKFVSHASIMIECQHRNILCDPWLIGKAFNEGWALISPPSKLSFSEIDYVWISHEHPDHLNFPTLKMISPLDRKRITILYQYHASPRVIHSLQQIEKFDIYLHDLDKIIVIQPGGDHEIIDATPDLAKKALFVMCSQVAWYFFAFSWGGGTVQVSGMYLDRFYAVHGPHPFFFYQNLLSTEVLEFGNIRQAYRTAFFFWRKKWEIWYRFVGMLRSQINYAGC